MTSMMASLTVKTWHVILPDPDLSRVIVNRIPFRVPLLDNPEPCSEPSSHVLRSIQIANRLL